MKRSDTMKGDTCTYCKKIAIGYYASGSRGSNVCEDHAPDKVKNLKSGETLEEMYYYAHKY